MAVSPQRPAWLGLSRVCRWGYIKTDVSRQKYSRPCGWRCNAVKVTDAARPCAFARSPIFGQAAGAGGGEDGPAEGLTAFRFCFGFGPGRFGFMAASLRCASTRPLMVEPGTASTLSTSCLKALSSLSGICLSLGGFVGHLDRNWVSPDPLPATAQRANEDLDPIIARNRQSKPPTS